MPFAAREAPLITGPAVEWLMFVIHDRPTGFIVTAVAVRDGEHPPVELPSRWGFATVAAARRAIRATKPGAVKFRREPEDPPGIVESWY